MILGGVKIRNPSWKNLAPACMVKLCEPPSKAGKLGWHQVHAIGADAGSYDEFSRHRHLGGPFDVSHLLVSSAGFLGGVPWAPVGHGGRGVYLELPE